MPINKYTINFLTNSELLDAYTKIVKIQLKGGKWGVIDQIVIRS